nr:rod shape-determining protein MreD [Actinomycetales bacterium]
MIVRPFVLAAVAVVLLAPVLQAAVVNRLGLPGGFPDLAVIGVCSLAVLTRPQVGALLGFAAGLATDIAPPADHSIGRHALVLCLAGLLCGKIPRDAGVGTRTAAAALIALGATLLDAAVAVLTGERGSHLAASPGQIAWTVLGTAAVVGVLFPLLRELRRRRRSRRWYHLSRRVR